MTFPLVQFVDGPSATAALRYDFTLQTASLRCLVLGGDGLDLGAPPFDGEPGGVGGRYDYRAMRFTQRVIGSKTDALARMNTLAKELLRSTNWLRVQLDPTRTPVYFKTYRTEPGALSIENIETAGAWDITVPLAAEPFAYGPLTQAVTNATVTQDSSGTNPMRLVLPAIKGDAPAPLRVSVAPGAFTAGGFAQWLLAGINGATNLDDRVIDIGTGDSASPGTGTGAPVADAAYLGGSYRAVTIGAATPNQLERLVMPWPVIQPGRYKVQLRCELDGGTGKTHLLKLGQSIALSGVFYAATTSVFVSAGSVFQGWVDLGEFTFPAGINPPYLSANVPAPTVALTMGTADGSASTARIDAFKLIPVDGPLVTTTNVLEAQFSKSPLKSNMTGFFDGDLESYWGVASSGDYLEGAPALAGSFPRVDPACAVNLLELMALGGAGGTVFGFTTGITSKGATAVVNAWYYPRYLHVGDGT